MTQYRNKPSVIEAERLMDATDMERVREFVGRVDIVIGWDHEKNEAITENTDGFRWLMIPDNDIVAQVFETNHNQWIGVKKGFWIIKGTQGEFYPCDPVVFAEKYEKVGE